LIVTAALTFARSSTWRASTALPRDPSWAPRASFVQVAASTIPFAGSPTPDWNARTAVTVDASNRPSTGGRATLPAGSRARRRC
jgi:hypothetical protein